MSLNNLTEEIHEANRDKGFWDGGLPNLTEKIMLVVSELAEAVEELRSNKSGYYEVNDKPEGVDVELVDALIRLLDILGYRGADVEKILTAKLAYNATRPYKHGRMF